MATATKDKKVIKAKIDFMRQTARKVRRTVNLIRGMAAEDAITQLRFLPYAAAQPIKKLVESAVANATNNFSVENPGKLLISEILVDDGPVFKRFRAASRGRATSIYKRTSQVKLVLSEMTPAEYAAYVWEISPRNRKAQAEKPAAKKETAEKKPAAKKPAAKKATTAKKDTKKPAAKKTTKAKAETKKEGDK